MLRFVIRILRFLITINMAIVIRSLRFGPKDAFSRLARIYWIINPFGSRKAHNEELRKNELRLLYNSIPEVSLEHVVSPLPQVQLDVKFASEDGSLPIHELITLLCVLKSENPEKILEIGTFFGSTTANMAINLPHSVISTVDLPEEISFIELTSGELKKDDFHLIKRRRVGKAFRESETIKNVTQHFGDTATWDFSRAGTDLSFVFIDGSHSYDYVKNDTIESFLVAKREFTILWHDVSLDHSGILKWFDEMLKAGIPVKRLQGTTLGYLKFTPDHLPRSWVESQRTARPASQLMPSSQLPIASPATA